MVEELAAPQPNRLGRLLAVLLGLLLAGVFVVHLVESGSSTNSATPAAPTTTSGPTVHPVLLPVPDRFSMVPPFRSPTPCPQATDGQAACTTYPGLAPATARALRERFPHIVVEHAVTQLLRPSAPEVSPGLWSREIEARVGALRMRMAVRRAEPQDAGTTGLRQGNRVQLIRYFRGRYLVQFELRGPIDPDSLSLTIAWLLTEHRLVGPAVARGGTMMR